MMKKFVVMLSAVMLMAVPTLGLAAMAGSNTVNSAAIVDGSVATADLANKAVTAAKIADATITATQLANGAVTVAKLGIVCSTGQTLTYNSTTKAWACGTAPAGPAGPQGIQGIQGIKGDKGDTPHYANVVVVAKSGGDFTDPIAAVASITDASDENPYLVQIMPGVYDLSGTIVMNNNIELVGSGEAVTKLRQQTSAATIFFNQTLPSKASVKNLSVEVLVTPNDQGSIIELGGASPIIEKVTITSGVGGRGSLTNGGSPVFRNVTFNISGGSWSNCVTGTSSASTFEGVTCNSTTGYSTGIETYLGNIVIKNSSINANLYPIRIMGMRDIDPVIYVINSQIQGYSMYSGLGIIKCISSYDGNFSPLVCQ
ncbi:MAG TPA: hypothetical protein HPP97_14135 [Desulfuromonadales bacterium]|nr:hypothetical protein [Desulfuromonadales bacterium]